MEMISNAAEFIGSKINIQPSSYKYLFPSGIDDAKIQAMVDSKIFPTIAGLAPAFTYALILGVIRLCLQKVFFERFALSAMKLKIIPQLKDSQIDSAFRNPKLPTDASLVVTFCTGSSRQPNEVNRYLSIRRRNAIVHNRVVKFVEALWRFIFYAIFCILGFKALFVPDTAIWVTDTMNHWVDYPLHRMSSFMQFYYQVELGSYIHQLMWTEVNRSDALEMILHHVTTILLLGISFLTNFMRIGTSILLLHDCSDVFLESAKCVNYTSKAPGRAYCKTICDVMFACFATVFFITRLVLYPRYIVYSVLAEAPVVFGVQWMGFWVFAVLLLVLQCLHIFWFALITRMIYRLITTGIEKDERSDDESDLVEDDVQGEDHSKKTK